MNNNNNSNMNCNNNRNNNNANISSRIEESYEVKEITVNDLTDMECKAFLKLRQEQLKLVPKNGEIVNNVCDIIWSDNNDRTI